MSILGRLAIPITGKCAYKLALAALQSELFPEFFGKLPTLRFIHDVFDWDQNVIPLAAMICVYIIIDGNKAHTFIREHHFQIFASLNIFPA